MVAPMLSSVRCGLALLGALFLPACEPEPEASGGDGRSESDAAVHENEGGSRAPSPALDGATRTRDASSAPHDAAALAPDADLAQTPADAALDEPPTDGGAPRDAQRADAGEKPLRDSFERAQRIATDGSTLLIDELSADQVDYFVFTAEAGTYYEITTDNARFSPDNTIALYDGARELLAENDDGSVWPGDEHDARLVVRAKSSGDHFIRVEDPYTPAEFFDNDFALLYFHLGVRALTEGTEGFARAPSSGVLPAFATDEESGYRYLTVVGEFGDSAARFDFEGIGEHALIARVHSGGVHGDGSTVADGRVTVRSEDGRSLAAIERAGGGGQIRPPVGMGKLSMLLEPGGALGDNAFYAADLVLLPDNPREQRERDNDRASGAEPVKLSNGSTGRGLLLSRLPADDVDYYRVEAQPDQRVYVSCEGEATGSGVRGLVAELRDGKDTMLGNASEVDDGLTLEWIVSKADTYYVRLTSRTPPGNQVDPWVRCVVFVN